MRIFLYRNATWYPIQLMEVMDKSIAETEFVPAGSEAAISLFDYVIAKAGKERAALDTQSGLENEGGASPESGAGCPPVLSAGVVEADSPHQRSGSERAAPGIDQGARGAFQFRAADCRTVFSESDLFGCEALDQSERARRASAGVCSAVPGIWAGKDAPRMRAPEAGRGAARRAGALAHESADGQDSRRGGRFPARATIHCDSAVARSRDRRGCDEETGSHDEEFSPDFVSAGYGAL